MSFTSWKKEFYPKPADDFDGDSTVDIIKHSLKKWQGLTPANLKKHNMVARGHRISGKVYNLNNTLYLDSDSCSLCQVYWGKEEYWSVSSASPCQPCPLYKARGKVSCFSKKRTEKVSPYDAFTDAEKPTPMPMIRWLKKTLTIAEGNIKVLRAKRS